MPKIRLIVTSTVTEEFMDKEFQELKNAILNGKFQKEMRSDTVKKVIASIEVLKK